MHNQIVQTWRGYVVAWMSAYRECLQEGRSFSLLHRWRVEKDTRFQLT